MEGSVPECPRGHAGSAFHVRKDGWAATKDGRRQMYRCVGADGPLIGSTDRRPSNRRSMPEGPPTT
jgi:hypothetical protein